LKIGETRRWADHRLVPRGCMHAAIQTPYKVQLGAVAKRTSPFGRDFNGQFLFAEFSVNGLLLFLTASLIEKCLTKTY